MDLATALAVASFVFGVGCGVGALAIRVEHRLTRLETLVHLLVEDQRPDLGARAVFDRASAAR